MFRVGTELVLLLWVATLSCGCFGETLAFRSTTTTTTTTWHARSLAAIRAPTTAMAMASSSSSGGDAPPRVVIAGAGIVGCCTAYYLARDHGIATTLVDPTGTIAPAASGKAGGFLALDWNDHSPVGPLARRGFALHQELSDALGATTIDYRRLTCAAVAVGLLPGRRTVARPSGKKVEGVEWAAGDAVRGMQPMGDEETIAQVHPKKLCEALWRETRELAPASSLVEGKVAGASRGEGGVLEGAELADGGLVVEGSHLLYACGPWTANVMNGVKYHSVVIPTETTRSQCVFFSGCGDPEVYVRPDQTAYCTGFPDAPVRVQEEPGQEEVRDDAVARIETAVATASGLAAENDGERLAQACYLPGTPDGVPLMGAVSGEPGCFVAAGHSCWGILMGPATGEAMAHLIATGESPRVDLAAFNPARMRGMTMVPRL